MTDEHILMICAVYAEQLREFRPLRQVVSFHGVDRDDFKLLALRHCAYMVQRITEQVEAGQREKAFRWLGFVQGVFYAVGYANVEDMRALNKDSGSSVFDKFQGWTPEQITKFINDVLAL